MKNQDRATSRSLSTRLNNLAHELILGISTRGIVDVENPDSNHYATMSYFTIERMLGFLSLQSSDVLVDVGCGKGRILCCAARIPARKIIGVDLSKEFCEQAKVNAGRLRGRRSPIEVHNSNARSFDYSGASVFVLFNPFGASTLDAVLAKIRLDVGTRPIRIAYANPVHDDIFARHAWLDQYEHWDENSMKLEHSFSFYRSSNR